MSRNFILFLAIFSYGPYANALKSETNNNFTRFIFDPSDFYSNYGNINNMYWHYSDFRPIKGCALSTVPIFLTQKAQLNPQLEIKSTAYTWIASPADLTKIQLFQLKAYANDRGYQEILSAPFYLKELRDIETISYFDNGSYIKAKTENDEFIVSKLNFNKSYADGRISFCIENVSERTEIFISSLAVDVIH
ncbi:hypothetical protein [Fluviispira multicolorata]|uniref:Uncharacterized protein n=1 Tax=Fluviispira multicolorata TaxID=2654512 RepID=A0A833N4Q2_9BACT|nr:hypothetical protein [Fluviispira multicolorata]KAB8032271.1 hypothetical protein GCL57_06375 [Fluviispira multicolorata]